MYLGAVLNSSVATRELKRLWGWVLQSWNSHWVKRHRTTAFGHNFDPFSHKNWNLFLYCIIAAVWWYVKAFFLTPWCHKHFRGKKKQKMFQTNPAVSCRFARGASTPLVWLQVRTIRIRENDWTVLHASKIQISLFPGSLTHLHNRKRSLQFMSSRTRPNKTSFELCESHCIFEPKSNTCDKETQDVIWSKSRGLTQLHSATICAWIFHTQCKKVVPHQKGLRSALSPPPSWVWSDKKAGWEVHCCPHNSEQI